jgi:hypothetical protein
LPRNGSGTFALEETIANGDTADATILMENLTDIASGLTGSLALNGESTLTGPVKAASGSVSSPGYQFGSDSNTGFYRIGGDNIGATCGGTKILDIGTGGQDIVGDLDVSGALTLGTALAVAEGGTGATTAAAAATALGLGTGDSPEFTAVSIDNTDTTITRSGAGVIAVEGSDVLMASNIASQAQMEAATSTSTVVTPGRQHFHPGMAKAWASVGNNGSASLGQDYNVDSVTRNNTGDVTVTFSTAMSGVGYAALATLKTGAGDEDVAISDKQTTFVRVLTYSSGVAADRDFSILIFGDM